MGVITKVKLGGTVVITKVKLCLTSIDLKTTLSRGSTFCLQAN